MSMREIRRIQAEIKLLEMEYGSENVLWARNYSWLNILKYRLPPQYNREITPIIVPVPEHYGNGSPYMDFFVGSGLRLLHSGGWVVVPHYYEKFPYSRLDDKFVLELKENGWSYLCVHPEKWTQEDNIFTFLNQVYVFLCDPFRDWEQHEVSGGRNGESISDSEDDEEYDEEYDE